jgi:hypothetical protein
VLVALQVHPGERVEATRELPAAEFLCPSCGWRVILKRGRVKVPHFAHQSGSPECASGGESVTHMSAKALLAREFRAQGYTVELEEAHPQQHRRVDVAVTLTDRTGAVRRIAVEIQDSAISVDEVKRRSTADRSAGFFATVWVFTLNRLGGTRSVLPGYELRLPEEMRYLINRWRTPIAVLDVEREQLFLVSTDVAVRVSDAFHNAYGEEQWPTGRTLKSTKEVFPDLGEFTLTAVCGRYAAPGRPDYTAGFRLAPRTEPPWQLITYFSDREPLIEDLRHAPGRLDGRPDLLTVVDDGGSARLSHLSTGRSWNLVRGGTPATRTYSWKFEG